MLDRFDEVVQTVVSLLLQQVLSVPDEFIASVDQRLCKGLVVIRCTKNEINFNFLSEMNLNRNLTAKNNPGKQHQSRNRQN